MPSTSGPYPSQQEEALGNYPGTGDGLSRTALDEGRERRPPHAVVPTRDMVSNQGHALPWWGEGPGTPRAEPRIGDDVSPATMRALVGMSHTVWVGGLRETDAQESEDPSPTMLKGSPGPPFRADT